MILLYNKANTLRYIGFDKSGNERHMYRSENRWIIQIKNAPGYDFCDLKPEYEKMKCPLLGKDSDFCSNTPLTFGEFECAQANEYEFGSFISMPNGFGLAEIDNSTGISTINISKTVCFNRCKSNKGKV